jgi:hypothetical protein
METPSITQERYRRDIYTDDKSNPFTETKREVNESLTGKKGGVFCFCVSRYILALVFVCFRFGGSQNKLEE